MPEFLENQANIHNTNIETPPLEEPLGIKNPLLSAAPLGQNFLSAQFILPLGAKPINLINWSLISPNESAVQGFMDEDLWQDSSFAEFQPLHQNLPPSETLNVRDRSPTSPTTPPSTAASSQPETSTPYRLEPTLSKPSISRKKATSQSHFFLQKSEITSERKQKDEAAESSEELTQVPEVQTAVNSEENSASNNSQIESIPPEVNPQSFTGNTTDSGEDIPQKREFLSRFISDVRSPTILQQNQESFGALSQEAPDSPTLNPPAPKSVGKSYREANIQRKETITNNQGSETVNLSEFDPSFRNDSNSELTSQGLAHPPENESLLPTSDEVAATNSEKEPEVSSTIPPARANTPHVQKSQETLVYPPLKSSKQPTQPPRTRLASIRESLQLSQDSIAPTSEAIESQQLSSEPPQLPGESLTATSEAVQSKSDSSAAISNLQKQVEPRTETFSLIEPLIPASDRSKDISTFSNQPEPPAPTLQKQDNLQTEISPSRESEASTSKSKAEFYPAITQPDPPAANLQKSETVEDSPQTANSLPQNEQIYSISTPGESDAKPLPIAIESQVQKTAETATIQESETPDKSDFTQSILPEKGRDYSPSPEPQPLIQKASATTVTMGKEIEAKRESAVEPSASASFPPEIFSQTSANLSNSEPLKGVSANQVELSDSSTVQLTSSALKNVAPDTEIVSPPLAASPINSPDVNLSQTPATQSQFENPKIQAFLESSQASDRAISANSESILEPTAINSLVDGTLKSEAQPIASVQREAIAPIDPAAGVLSAEVSSNIKEENSSANSIFDPSLTIITEQSEQPVSNRGIAQLEAQPDISLIESSEFEQSQTSNEPANVEPQTEPFSPLEPFIPASDRSKDISTFTNQPDTPAANLQKSETLEESPQTADSLPQNEPNYTISTPEESDAKPLLIAMESQVQKPVETASIQRSETPGQSDFTQSILPEKGRDYSPNAAPQPSANFSKSEALEGVSSNRVESSDSNAVQLTPSPLTNAPTSEAIESPQLSSEPLQHPGELLTATSEAVQSKSDQEAEISTPIIEPKVQTVEDSPQTADRLPQNESNYSISTPEIASIQRLETRDKSDESTVPIEPFTSISKVGAIAPQFPTDSSASIPNLQKQVEPQTEPFSPLEPFIPASDRSKDISTFTNQPEVSPPSLQKQDNLQPEISPSSESEASPSESKADIQEAKTPDKSDSSQAILQEKGIDAAPGTTPQPLIQKASATPVTMGKEIEIKAKSAAVEPSAIASFHPKIFSQTSGNFSQSELLEELSANRVESSDSNAVQLTSSPLTNAPINEVIESKQLSSEPLQLPGESLTATSEIVPSKSDQEAEIYTPIIDPEVQRLTAPSKGEFPTASGENREALTVESPVPIQPFTSETATIQRSEPRDNSDELTVPNQPLTAISKASAIAPQFPTDSSASISNLQRQVESQTEPFSPLEPLIPASDRSKDISTFTNQPEVSPPSLQKQDNLQPEISPSSESEASTSESKVEFYPAITQPDTPAANLQKSETVEDSPQTANSLPQNEPNYSISTPGESDAKPLPIAAQLSAQAAPTENFTFDPSLTIISEQSEQPASNSGIAQLEAQPDIALKESSEIERSHASNTHLPKIQLKAGGMPTPQELLEMKNEPANAENGSATPEVLPSSTAEGQGFGETRSPLSNQPPIVQRDLEPHSLLPTNTSEEESKAEARSLASTTPQFIQHTSETQQVEPSFASEESSEESSEIARSRIPTQPQFIQPHSEAQPTQPSIISEGQTPTEKHSFHPSSNPQPTAISEEEPPTETQTVAQLLSQPGATPQLPSVLKNLAHSHPLGIAHPFVQRSEFRSGIPLSEAAETPDSEEYTASFNPSPTAIFPPANKNYPTDIFSANNLVKSNPVIQRKVSQNSAEDVPDSWSSIEELLGSTSSPASEATMVQTFPSHKLPTAKFWQKIKQQQRRKVPDIRTSALLPPGVYMGATKLHSFNFQQQPSSIRKLMEKTLQSRAKLEEKAASQTAQVPQQIPMSSIAGVFANKGQTISSTDEATQKESEKEQTDCVEALAREIYSLLRQRLEIERERYGSYYSHSLL